MENEVWPSEMIQLRNTDKINERILTSYKIQPSDQISDRKS